MTLFYDATIVGGGVVRSMRQHDSATLDPDALATARRLVRKDRHQGPLEFDLPDVGVPLPWADWHRDGPDAVLSLTSSDGTPITYSALVSGRGPAGTQVLEGMASAYDREPGADGMVITDATVRPLMVTMAMPTALLLEEDAERMLQVCARVEVLLAAAFFDVLRVSAPKSERWG